MTGSVNYQDGKWNFCENANICDDEGSISSTDPECTEKGSPYPENYIRYSDYCPRYRADCDANPTNVYCDGLRRSDGLTICDKPDHPGYKFCRSD